MKRPPLILAFLPILTVFSDRDPFWPIGYSPEGLAPPPQEKPEAAETPQPQAARQLTDEELNKLAEQEAAKIKEILDRKATAVFGGKVHALVNGEWVSVGDSITVKVLGNSYRLEILKLTPNNIELEPHRSQTGSPSN